MKKKVLAVLLVLAIAVTAVSAKEVGVKVGAELGWGFDVVKSTRTLKLKSSDSLVRKFYNNGFTGNLTAEYDFNEYFGVKASFGLMFAGQAKAKTGDSDKEEIGTEKSGTYIDAALDAKYSVALSDTLSLSGLAGVEIVSGYISKYSSSDENEYTKNFAFGFNAGAELSYDIAKNIDINFGCTVAWLFTNNAKILEGKTLKINDTEIYSYKSTSFFVRPYVGCTYAF